MRARDCIYCGNPTGSKEHSFPAALGGRRVNKGILCGPCNEGFSPLDAEVSAQLEGINGLLGVVSDHRTDPHLARALDLHRGREYRVDAEGRASLAEPVVTEEVLEDGTKQVQVLVSSEKQFQQWLAKQHASGLTPKRVSREEWTSYSTGMEIRWSFGGPLAFREIGRVAMNFLAHSLPVVARRPEFRPFKDFVIGASTDAKFVAYSDDDPDLPKNAFDFGHRVLIGIDADTGDHYARVDLFSTFRLVVHFGVADAHESQTIITDIDPLAANPPDDMTTRILSGQSLARVRQITRDRPDYHLALRKRMLVLLEKIKKRRWEATSGPVVRAINATIPLGKFLRVDALRQTLAEHRQRVINLIRNAVSRLQHMVEPGVEDNLYLAAVHGSLDLFIEHDLGRREGVTQTTEVTAFLVENEIVRELVRLLDAGHVQSEDVRELLEGDRGIQLAANALFKVIRLAT